MPFGNQIRALRRRESLTQAQLALRLGISASYLNLIEHDRRQMPAQMLLKLAQLFRLDLNAFTEDEGAIAQDLVEVFGDPVLDAHPLGTVEIKEMAGAHPVVARAVIDLYRRYKDVRDRADELAGRISEAPTTMVDPSLAPAEDVSEFIQRQMNHFPVLDEAAERLWQDARLGLDDLYGQLSRHLERAHKVRVEIVREGAAGGAVRRFDPINGVLQLSELLPPRSRNFQLAHQLALLMAPDTLDTLTDHPDLTSVAARGLGRIALANYFAAAVLMPYKPFWEAARAERYDVELLGHRFRTSFEQVCHRLTTLRRPGMEGVPFHYIRVDLAGNLSKRFSASGIRFARFSGACPRWNVHAAFLSPGQIRTQVSQMPDGTTYFCLARTLGKHAGGWHSPVAVHAVGLGVEVSHAKELVYADGLNLEAPLAVVPIGTSCRLCARTNCEQRAFPPMHRSMHIDENVRGVSLYAPPDDGR